MCQRFIELIDGGTSRMTRFIPKDRKTLIIAERAFAGIRLLNRLIILQGNKTVAFGL